MPIHRICLRKSTSALRFFSQKSTPNIMFSIFSSQGLNKSPTFSQKLFSDRSAFLPFSLHSMHISTPSGDELREKQAADVSLNGENKIGDENLGGNNSVGDRNAPDGDSNSPEDADQIFQKMKETGLVPNAVAMLDGLSKDGLVQEAMKLFGEMREKGNIPEVIVYTAVVEGFCRAKKLDDAKRIFKKMKDNGVVPNAFSYCVLIQGLCKDKKLEEAVDYSLEMLDQGWRPNVATFVSIIDGFCKELRSDEAKAVINQFKEKGFIVDEKAVREYMDKKGPFFPSVWEVMFGKRAARGTI
uniref:Pentacotripeptide-repeat region of PRORP domain-containing protein n=1 Tax=Picea sitchensis TaxID=3332 RepID=A9P1K1_PICSI|nr:unknown [Picea sitchensis]